jgi:uncharacterized membrane protein
MASGDLIRNPFEWVLDGFRGVSRAVSSTAHAVHLEDDDTVAPVTPEIRRIEVADLKEAIRRGFEDFGAFRTDVLFICVIYPLAGLVLAQVMFGNRLVPLLFPLASGFALVGPVAAVGLYEMSRRHERGDEITWWDAFNVVRSEAFGAIFVLAAWLGAIFLLWLGAAWSIYLLTLGPEAPTSIGSFISDVLTTAPGWTMIIVGMGIGFCFALIVLTVSVVSFPMLLDRDVGLARAVTTSVRAVRENPRTMAIWGLIVAGSLALGMLPAFLGLIVVVPVLGHSTWHLYRRVVAWPAEDTSSS